MKPSWRLTYDLRVVVLVFGFVAVVPWIGGSDALTWAAVGCIYAIAIEELGRWLDRRDSAA